jgi:hypothetical protein
MGRVFVNRTLMVFQSVAFFLYLMLVVLLIGILGRSLLQLCLISSCVGPVYLIVLIVHIGGTVLSPLKIEIFDNSVKFHHFLKLRSKSLPYNRIREIQLPARARSNRIVILDDHGKEHRFYMVSFRISKEIIKAYEDFRVEHEKDE